MSEFDELPPDAPQPDETTPQLPAAVPLPPAPTPEPAAPESAATDEGIVPPINGRGDSGYLPIPLTPPPDPRVQITKRRMQHRRKRYTMFLVRSHRRRQEEKSTARRRVILFCIAGLLAIILGSIATAAEAAYSYYQSELPQLEAIGHNVVSSDSVQFYDEHGTLIYQANYSGIKHSIAFNQMPLAMLNATIATEDQYFYTNDGIDIQRILSAAYQDIFHKGGSNALQGASTITQQLIKQTVLDASPNLDRKIREAILAFGVTEGRLFNNDWQKNKQEILNLYLNVAPYGPDIYGVDSAAHEYFGYSDNLQTGEAAAHHLDLAQAAFLAGIPQDPNGYDPMTPGGLSQALIRLQEVLGPMVKQHYITQAQADAATKEANAKGFIHQLPPEDTQNLAPDFVSYVTDELNSMIVSGQLNTNANQGQLNAPRSGLKVYTTLDLPLQQQVQQIMANHLFCNDYTDYGTPLFYDNASEAAAVLAQQSTGDLRVLLGSWDYYATVTPAQCSFHKPYFQNGVYHPATYTPNPQGKAVANQFDTATQGYRQPGSTFKLIDYSTAFEKGWFPAMTLDDVPTIFPDPGGPTGAYKPLDAEGSHYYGEMTIRKALQFSMDIPAIKTAAFDSVPSLLQTMQRLGITSYNGTPGLAMAIGSLGVHPIDMVQAYATIANYGRKVPFNGIDHIVDGEGNTIYQYSAPRGTQAFSTGVSYLMTNVLSDNPARINDNRAHPGGFGFGGCSPLFLAPNGTCNPNTGTAPFYFPAAAKTGTTDNLADDWTMGYTMDYTGGIWVGNKDETDYMRTISGITGAAPIWYKMMMAAEQEKSTLGVGVDHTPQQFPVPQDVVRATFSSNGITSTDWFLKNNVPTHQGIGNGGPTSVCINVTYAANDAWDYCTAPPKQPAQPTPPAKP